MDKWLLMFFFGALLSLFLPIVPTLFYIYLLLVAAIALIISKRLSSITGLLLGCAWILFHGFIYQHSFNVNHLIKNTLQRTRPVIQGKVLTLNSKRFSNQQFSTTGQNSKSLTQVKPLRFNLLITQFNQTKLLHPFIVRLSWRYPTIAIAQNNTIRVQVKLRPAHGLANVGSFNYQVWLRYKNIVATGYVVNSVENIIVNSTVSFRQRQLNQLIKILPDHPLSALILALTLGDRSYITQPQWQVLTATGTQHLIAISGLHLGLVAAFVFSLVIFLLRITPIRLIKSTTFKTTITQFNSHYIAIFASLLATLIYASLSGFAIPTIRALLMLSLYWLTRIIGIKLTLHRWLLLVIFFVILSAPMSLLSASFWLSFYAVMVIFLLLWRFISRQKTPSKQYNSMISKLIYSSLYFIKNLLMLQLGLTLFLLPITLFFYHKMSVVAFFANIMAVPWMSVTAIPLSLAAVLILPFSEQLARYLFMLCLRSLDVLWQWLSYLANQSWSLQWLSEQTILLVSLVIISLACWLFLSFKRHYFLYCVPIVLVLWLNLSRSTSPLWRVTVFDVGQSLATVIERNHHVIIYDIGAKYASGFNMVDAVIMPYLKNRNIKAIDYVIISHNDSDHLDGLTTLRKNMPIKTLMANNPLLLPQKSCVQGSFFTWQGLRITQLWPKYKAANRNNDFCVVRVSDGSRSVLFTGDASKKVERQLIKSVQILQSNVLIAPHHGAKSALNETFLKKVNPQYAIFSSGYMNRWRMPVKEMLLRYHRHQIKTYVTAKVGMIQIKLTKDNIQVLTYHDDFFPYWFAN